MLGHSTLNRINQTNNMNWYCCLGFLSLTLVQILFMMNNHVTLINVLIMAGIIICKVCLHVIARNISDDAMEENED